MASSLLPSSCSRQDRITISLPGSDDNNSDEINVRLESMTEANHRKHPLLLLVAGPVQSALSRATQRIFLANDNNDDSNHHHAVVRSVSIYMASEATKVITLLRLNYDQDDNDERSVVRTGPSGIMVQVEFVVAVAAAAATSNEKESKNLLDMFYALLIDLVDLQVLPGPFGLSMQRRRLHRHVECITTTSTATTPTGKWTTIQQCTAHIPLEGAHNAASAESFRQFLQGGRPSSSSSATGIFSYGSPYEWSSWWMGKTSQSLDDARNIMAGGGFHHHQDDDDFSVIPTRPARWIEWSRDNCTNDVANNRSCRWMVTRGIQYDVLIRKLDQKLAASSLSLSSLLPNAESPILAIDPFADHTFIDVVRNGRRTNVALAATEQLLAVDDDGVSTAAKLRYTPTTSVLDLSRVYLQSNDDEPPPPPPQTDDKYNRGRCSIHSRILRDRGQSNTGTLELYTENACGGETSCRVVIRQLLPAFVSPIWRSLKILGGEDQAITFHELGDGSHIDLKYDGSSRITMHTNATSLRLLLDYDPAFLSIDSFPGDANRGFEIPSARASFHCGSGSKAMTRTVHLYTDTQLVLSPLPDMSMPFNVISLTCTFYAFVVGSILNLAIKKASKHVMDQLNPDQTEPDSLAGKIKVKISSLVRAMYQKIRRVVVPPTPSDKASNPSASPIREETGAMHDKKNE